ncbi:GNAT family N-acetyltransferase [Pseudomonas quasicaspiana]|uniref:GNAT family N-acetyltransferase n=1 Tax=Pseudomonas quasicaspiana TaxID=2829821 RepID=UPI001E4167FD|nr:GNAT family N-acetyltransferase [Pseudomonas quasicaspiana]MCD5976496.1 GNAT family N-acetyltransferase [Pseudomonas quasicaspiana]
MFTIRTMTMDDYDAVIALMSSTPGVSVRDADSRDSTSRYLQRNPGMSFVAEVDSVLVGCVMCGHDGRRGYLQHLLVLDNYRRQGIANQLVERCLASLEREGIFKCHIDVFKTNHTAADYWVRQGWQLRTDIDRYSFIRTGNDNA